MMTSSLKAQMEEAVVILVVVQGGSGVGGSLLSTRCVHQLTEKAEQRERRRTATSE